MDNLYTKEEADNKYRSKTDLTYKKAIDIPFENVQDSSGMWEVKIKMNRGTHLVGTITNDAGVVKEFDFIFDYDEYIPDGTDIYISTEIDGITYPVNYYQTESGEWRFHIESDTGYFF